MAKDYGLFIIMNIRKNFRKLKDCFKICTSTSDITCINKFKKSNILFLSAVPIDPLVLQWLINTFSISYTLSNIKQQKTNFTLFFKLLYMKISQLFLLALYCLLWY